MSTSAKVLVVLSVAAASFVAGTWYQRNPGNPIARSGAPRILYYRDPMHPAYRSDKPGVAPDCGMQLEPVYEGGASSGSSAPPVEEASATGAIHINADHQQAIGLTSAVAEKLSGSRPIRVLGRVAADETRVSRAISATEGWIRSVSPVTTGRLVKKGETLASLYALEFLPAERAYVFALMGMDRYQASGQETAAQIEQSKATIQQGRLTLRNLGMSDAQIEEVTKTRKTTEEIRLSAPSAGIVISRNIFEGQKFDRGTEFFRIADLSRVWVIADLFESDVRLLRSLRGATVHYQGQAFAARVSDTLPQFDAVSRALRVRLELDNPGYLLRPDMFVDVEFTVGMPEGVTVPTDAVVDSGLRKVVYVEQAAGVFEPRAVETGLRLGDRVQITKGVAAGERVVVSGNFILDSESRMKMTAVAIPSTVAPAASSKDPTCGMPIDPAKAAGKSEYKGKTYYFCSKTCKEGFDKNPSQFAGKEHIAQVGGRDD